MSPARAGSPSRAPAAVRADDGGRPLVVDGERVDAVRESLARRGPLVDRPAAAPALLGGRHDLRAQRRRLPRPRRAGLVPPALTRDACGRAAQPTSGRRGVAGAAGSARVALAIRARTSPGGDQRRPLRTAEGHCVPTTAHLPRAPAPRGTRPRRPPARSPACCCSSASRRRPSRAARRSASSSSSRCCSPCSRRSPSAARSRGARRRARRAADRRADGAVEAAARDARAGGAVRRAGELGVGARRLGRRACGSPAAACSSASPRRCCSSASSPPTRRAPGARYVRLPGSSATRGTNWGSFVTQTACRSVTRCAAAWRHALRARPGDDRLRRARSPCSRSLLAAAAAARERRRAGHRQRGPRPAARTRCASSAAALRAPSAALPCVVASERDAAPRRRHDPRSSASTSDRYVLRERMSDGTVRLTVAAARRRRRRGRRRRARAAAAEGPHDRHRRRGARRRRRACSATARSTSRATTARPTRSCARCGASDRLIGRDGPDPREVFVEGGVRGLGAARHRPAGGRRRRSRRCRGGARRAPRPAQRASHDLARARERRLGAAAARSWPARSGGRSARSASR